MATPEYDPEKEYQYYTEQIDQIDNTPIDTGAVYNEWKASKKPIVDIIMRNYKKPEPQLTERQAEQAKFSSALTDTLTTVGEMFAHGQGARVRNRTTPTNTKQTNARIKAIQDKQDADMLQWQSAMGNAEMQDFNQHLSTAMQQRGEKRNYYLRKAEQTARAIQARSKAEAEARKAAQDQANFETEHAETVRKNKAGEAIDWANLNKKDKKATVPVFIDNKQYNFPAEFLGFLLKIEIFGVRPCKTSVKNEVFFI